MSKLRKRVYRVVAEGLPTCCKIECNRSGDLVAFVFTDVTGGAVVRQYGSPEIACHVAQAFATNFITGFVYLVFRQMGSRLPASISYLREFGKAMFTYWLLAERATGAAPAGPPDGLIAGWIQVARETPDMETLTGELLEKIWERVRGHVREELVRSTRTLAEFLVQNDPSWGKIGRIVFKLDDVMEDAARPFVLTTSYFDGIIATKSVVTTPISVVIFGECRVAGLRRHVYDLLRQAGQRSEVVRRLVESQEIFAPCTLIPREAHAFVRDAAALEALGIEIILPRWWKDLKQPEIRVRTRIGTSAPKAIGIGPLLDLHTAYVVGEHELTEAEWRPLVRGHDGGLVYLRGQWVDLTRLRIEAAVQAARQVEELRAGGGVSYAEALELTAARLPGDEPTPPTAPTSPATFEPGPWLEAALSAIERQDLRRDANPGVRLRAQLFAYQRQGVAWLSTLMDVGAGALLADDMGLGKTLQVIALILTLLRREVEGPHLIVVPTSLLTNWQREFERFAPTLDVAIVHGADDLEEPVPYVTLTSYGMVLRRESIQKRQWGLVVLDEAQEIKNPKTRLALTTKRLRSRMRVCLTGTPVENHFGELWSIMDFLNPGLLGSEPEFREWCKVHLAGAEGLAPLRRRLRPFILRRLKTDPAVALDLPSKVEVTVFCGMTSLQSGLYGKAYANMRAEFEVAEGKQRQGIAFKVITRLKQVCDHPALVLENDNDFDPRSSGKFIRLAELATSIAEGGDRMLVFTQYKEMTGPIAAHLEHVLGRPGAILDGDTPMKQRQQIVADFQGHEGPPFLVLTFGVGGTGFNLTAACHVILFDRWWNPAVENQAMDRAFRIGQTKGVVVHKFVCRGTLEQRIDALIQRKHELAQGLFSSEENPDQALGKLSPEELLSLLALDPALAHIDEA